MNKEYYNMWLKSADGTIFDALVDEVTDDVIDG